MGPTVMGLSNVTPWYALSLFYASLVLVAAAFIAGILEDSVLNDMRRSYLDASTWNPDSDPTSEEGYESVLHGVKTMQALSFVVEHQDKAVLDSDKSISIDEVLETVQRFKPSRSMMRKWQRSITLLSYSWVLAAGGLALHVLSTSSWREPKLVGLKVNPSDAFLLRQNVVNQIKSSCTHSACHW